MPETANTSWRLNSETCGSARYQSDSNRSERLLGVVEGAKSSDPSSAVQADDSHGFETESQVPQLLVGVSGADESSNDVPVTAAVPQYAGPFRRVSKVSIEKACREFQARVESGEVDVKVHVFTNVSGAKFLNGGVPSAFRDVFFAVTARDVWIIKMQGRAHEALVTEIGSQLRNFVVNNGFNGSVSAGGGHFRMPAGAGRRPDTGLRRAQRGAGEPHPGGYPRVVVEIEVKNRSLLALHAFSLEYLNVPEIRCVLAIKIFGRRGPPPAAANYRSFAAVAIVYAKDGAGNVSIADIVSFGTAPTSPLTNAHIAALNVAVAGAPGRAQVWNPAAAVRHLPVVTVAQTGGPVNPWTTHAAVGAGVNPTVTIPGDCIFVDSSSPLGVAAFFAAPPPPRPHVVVDLWSVLQSFAVIEF